MNMNGMNECLLDLKNQIYICSVNSNVTTLKECLRN